MLLLIEDNIHIAHNIQQYLELHDYTVHIEHDGRKWLEFAQHSYLDCIILDVMLPSMDWFEILYELRKTKQTPVIMTTAKGQLDDKANWFDLGADDYLVKPFEMKELLMRIKSILKRSQPQDVYVYNDIEIHLETNELFKQGQKIHLTTKERHILAYLLDHEWLTLSRSDIIEQIWGSDAIREDDSKLDVYISNLRKKTDKTLIETVKWVGYKIPRR